MVDLTLLLFILACVFLCTFTKESFFNIGTVNLAVRDNRDIRGPPPMAPRDPRLYGFDPTDSELHGDPRFFLGQESRTNFGMPKVVDQKLHGPVYSGVGLAFSN